MIGQNHRIVPLVGKPVRCNCGRTTGPTDFRRAIATKLQLEKEVEFAETGILLCFALCLLNLLLILESPAFAAAVICTAR